MTEESDVLATLEEYANAYCTKDTDRLMAIFDHGDNISLIGTGADELCSGQAEIRSVFDRNFSEATATEFLWHWQHVIVSDNCAVVATTLTIHLDVDGESIKVPIRWTVTMVKRDNEWKWLHRHASSAAGSQEEGSAYPSENGK